LERYQIEECSGRGLRPEKVTKMSKNAENNRPWIWGKNGCADFKQPYLGLRETKSGPRWLMEIWKREEQDGIDKCWKY
jgi:hypothetical protein